jgi:hypothetical protein
MVTELAREDLLSVVEQRYRGALALEHGEPKMVVTARVGVSCQTLYA